MGGATPARSPLGGAAAGRANRGFACSVGSASSIPRASTTTAPTAATTALRRAFELGPDGVIREVLDSKLMGRGGAAFPTGRKWEAVARQPRRPHYLICNADESEPGTFKDRVILEGDPFSLIEAMTIAGVRDRLRARLHLPARRVPARSATARERDRSRRASEGSSARTSSVGTSRFDIELRKGAGAYICGEETAIFGSIEGYRGEPRNKPPFPVERGLFGQPTRRQQRRDARQRPADRARGRRVRSPRSAPSARPGRSCSASPARCERSGHLRGAVRDDAARAARARRRRAPGRTLRAVLLGGAAGSFVTPDELDLPLDLRGRPRRRSDTRLGRRRRARRDGRSRRAADGDRRVLPRRELRPVRSVPRRDRAPGGGARSAAVRAHARHGPGRAGADRRDRAGDARRFDLRPRTDGVGGDRVGDRPSRRVQRSRRA